MIQIGNYIYKWCETGDWICCGTIKKGIDGLYIEWYA